MKKKRFFVPILTIMLAVSMQSFGGSIAAAQNGFNVKAQPVTAEAEPFTATTGLETFSSYRMSLTGEFDGTKDGRPSTGNLDGFLEVTRDPKAQHLQVAVDGDAFSTIAPLGRIEVYDVDNTFHIQNPRNGSWITVPAFLVNSMLPDGVPSPEDSIELPITAVSQSGTEVVNGVITQRYTFDANDLAAEHQSKYDDVQGTIWVAVNDNTIVSYEATVTGQFASVTTEAEAQSGQLGDLLGGDLSFIDEGTVTIRYDLSDINSDLSITPPQKAAGLFGFSLW